MGISCLNSSSNISYNKIINSSIEEGIGIHVNQGSPIITNNLIQGNLLDGICAYGGSARIEKNIITKSKRGIYLKYADSRSDERNFTGTISQNIIGANGTGIFIEQCAPIIKNNSIFKNSGVGLGGGIYTKKSRRKSEQSYLTPTILNNEIAHNLIKNYIKYNKIKIKALGGGIYIAEGASPTITNNYVHDNASEGECGGIANKSTTANIYKNCVIDNKAPVQKNGYTGKQSLNKPSKLTGKIGADKSKVGLLGKKAGLSVQGSEIGVIPKYYEISPEKMYQELLKMGN